MIELPVEPSDASGFVAKAQSLVNGIARVHKPEVLIVIKIRDWFGPRWLHFSRKAIGLVPVWKNTLTIPPFIPNRIVSQRRFLPPAYTEVDSGKPIHVRVPAKTALLRRAAQVAPQSALFWYSHNSRESGRGSIMSYLPTSESYEVWYAGWEGPNWRRILAKEISVELLSKLVEAGETVSIV